MAITTYTIPAEKIVHNTSVDFSSRFSIINPIHIVQYDNSLPIISVELKNDNKIYTLPTGIEVWIRWKKPDNTFVRKQALGCNSERNTVYFEIIQQMVMQYGLFKPVVELIIPSDSSDPSVASSGCFSVLVDRNPIQNGDIESITEYEDPYGNVCYTKTAIDDMLIEKADKATTLAGYGITNAYTKTDVDTAIDTAATDIKSVINTNAKTVEATVTPDKVNGYFVVLTGNWKKNDTVNISLNDDSGIISGEVMLQIFYETNTYTKIATVKANEVVNYTLTSDSEKIRCWIKQSAISTAGTVSLIVEQIGIVEKIAEIKEAIEILSNNLSGKTFSIIGDSYSAYKGWIPYENGYWYTNVEYDTQTNDRVDSVAKMWWYILSKKTKMSLICNESMSGTTISTTGYDGKDYTLISFTTRMKKTLGENNVTSPKPDIIFIFGGTNDDWANAPIGEVKYSDWTTDDLKFVLPAFCYLIDYIKLYNPHATIVNIVNERMDTNIATGMATACEHYGAVNIKLTGISKETGHPTATGQATIADEIITALKSMQGG